MDLHRPGGQRHRVFVVEDEPFVTMLIEDMLAELGHLVVGRASNLEGALAAAQSMDFDIAVLDVNLRGKSSQAVATLLRHLGRPFIVASGYSEGTLDGDYLGAPILQKPFRIDEVAEAISRLSAGAGGA